MSEDLEIVLPKLGESILSAKIVQWLKKEGDLVAEDEPLVEVATDKVNSEIPSPASGQLKKILVQVDAEVEVGAPLALLSSAATSTTPMDMPSHAAEAAQESSEPQEAFLSPAVLRFAQEQGLGLEQVSKITGTGKGGRVTRRDVENFALARTQSATSGDVERIPMSPMRKAIAENMTRSFYQAPHAYLVTEVDVTDLRAKIAAAPVKLTLTPYLIQALARAVKECPLLNASLDGDEIIVNHAVNVGVAVAVGDALLVPVVKGCHTLSPSEIAEQVADLATRARSGQLKPDEVRDGTITLTNFGMSGALLGLPIIRFPEVGIVGIGAIKKQFVPDENGQPVAREILNATLSFDHRAVDGMYAAKFVAAFKAALEHA